MALYRSTVLVQCSTVYKAAFEISQQTGGNSIHLREEEVNHLEEKIFGDDDDAANTVQQADRVSYSIR